MAGLSLDMPVAEYLAELVRALDAGRKQMAERGGGRGENEGRHRRPAERVPVIDLPDLMFEVHAWTGFLDAFVHLGDGTTPCPGSWSTCASGWRSDLRPVRRPARHRTDRARPVRGRSAPDRPPGPPRTAG